jgi:hypothetical protein
MIEISMMRTFGGNGFFDYSVFGSDHPETTSSESDDLLRYTMWSKNTKGIN